MANYRLGGKDPVEQRKENEQIRKNAVEGRATPSTQEQFNGLGTAVYGGIAAKDATNSYISMYDKYYKAATGGRSTYDIDTVNNRGFNQLIIPDRSVLSKFQPYIKGRFLFVPGEMPRCMELLHPDETNYMRNILQSCILQVDGFVSKRLDTALITAPTEQNGLEVVTKQTGVTREINLTFMALFQGLSIYKYITNWMQYIFNQGSSAATYPYFTGLEYHEGHHSMNAIYLLPDPSFQVVEEAALLYSMVPKDNQAGQIFNQTWQQHDAVSNFTIPFKVHTITNNPQVNKIATAVLADFLSEVELHDYRVVPANSTDPDTDTWGLGSSLLMNKGKEKMRELSELERSK